MRKRKRRKNKLNIEKPIFKLTKEQFELCRFRDKAGKSVQIGDSLINDFGVKFFVKYFKQCNEVILSGYCMDCNLNAIRRLRRIE